MKVHISSYIYLFVVSFVACLLLSQKWEYVHTNFGWKILKNEPQFRNFVLKNVLKWKIDFHMHTTITCTSFNQIHEQQQQQMYNHVRAGRLSIIPGWHVLIRCDMLFCFRLPPAFHYNESLSLVAKDKCRFASHRFACFSIFKHMFNTFKMVLHFKNEYETVLCHFYSTYVCVFFFSFNFDWFYVDNVWAKVWFLMESGQNCWAWGKNGVDSSTFEFSVFN